MNEHRFQWEVNVWKKGTKVGDFSHVSVCEGGDGWRKQDLVCANHVWRFQCVFPKELSIITAASPWKVQKIVDKKEAEKVINPVYNSIQMSGQPQNHQCRTQTGSSWMKSKWTELDLVCWSKACLRLWSYAEKSSLYNSVVMGLAK